MKTRWTRRGLLAASASVLATSALANAPLVTQRPLARRAAPAADLSDTRPRARPSTQEIIQAAGLGGAVGFVIADAETGRVLEAVTPDLPLPPASVAKAVTALYALETLGPDHRFDTRLLATGPVVDGVIEGDLVLAGGGDPLLQTDDLKALAQRLTDSGVTALRGALRVWGGALPGLDEIDESQLDHLGYNPAISGLNLNFNRVYFEWTQGADGYAVSMDARSETDKPPVSVARMRIVDRTGPVYAYRDGGNVDEWSVARRALGPSGSRWLPVRNPDLYAGEVLAHFLRAGGFAVPDPVRSDALPEGRVLAAHQSPPLAEVLRGMLRFSTNLTAEISGMTASAARAGGPRRLRTSALGMTRWADDRAGIACSFEDHSGLGDASRISAGDMVRLLSAPGVRGQLDPILRPIAFRDESGNLLSDGPPPVRAKTGTLNFVSTLAGYLTTDSGRVLAFAIFAADLAARDRGKASGEEQPNGSISYNTRAKRLQQSLLQYWARG